MKRWKTYSFYLTPNLGAAFVIRQAVEVVQIVFYSEKRSTSDGLRLLKLLLLLNDPDFLADMLLCLAIRHVAGVSRARELRGADTVIMGPAVPLGLVLLRQTLHDEWPHSSGPFKMAAGRKLLQVLIPA